MSYLGPRGRPPVLQFHFNWKTLSAIAGGTWWNFYFRLFPGTIRSLQVVTVLRHLLHHLPGKVLVIWDGLRAHHSRAVQTFADAHRGRLQLELLPAYAPELNPVEDLWGLWKTSRLAQLLSDDLRGTEGARPPSPPSHASPTDVGDGLLETSRPLRRCHYIT